MLPQVPGTFWTVGHLGSGCLNALADSQGFRVAGECWNLTGAANLELQLVSAKRDPQKAKAAVPAGTAAGAAQSDRSSFAAEIRRIPLFGAFPAAAVADVARLARVRTYPPQAVVVEQDEASDGVYLIDSGRLSVSVAAPGGRVVTIGEMGAGEIIGEISLLDGGPRSATVTAVTSSRLLTVGRGPFLELLRKRPQIAVSLVSTLAQRLRALTRWADDTVGLPVSARLAKRLIALVAEAGQQTGPGRFRIALKLSQSELGTRVGATRESVNKHLRRWEQSRILEQESGHLVILDVARLRAVAET